MRLFIFDLDNTILTNNCSFKYFSFLYQKSLLSNFSLIRALKYLVKFSYFNLSPTDLHNEIFDNFLKGKYFNDIFDHVDLFLDSYLSSSLNLKVLTFLEKAKEERVLILSNSPEYLTLPIAHRLGIKDLKGSTYDVDEQLRLVKIRNIMDGKAKAKYAKIAAQKDEIIVFTDSIWDRPLLEIANRCYVVNPDKKLFALAKVKGWIFL